MFLFFDFKDTAAFVVESHFCNDNGGVACEAPFDFDLMIFQSKFYESIGAASFDKNQKARCIIREFKVVAIFWRTKRIAFLYVLLYVIL